MIKAWWAKLTQASQKKYISEHPGSDLAKKVKAGKVKIGSLKQAEEATRVKKQIYQNQLLHLHQRYRKLQSTGGDKAKVAKLLTRMALIKHSISSLNH